MSLPSADPRCMLCRWEEQITSSLFVSESCLLIQPVLWQTLKPVANLNKISCRTQTLLSWEAAHVCQGSVSLEISFGWQSGSEGELGLSALKQSGVPEALVEGVAVTHLVLEQARWGCRDEGDQSTKKWVSADSPLLGQLSNPELASQHNWG